MEITGGKSLRWPNLKKRERMEELNKPKIVIGHPCLGGDLLAIGGLTKEKVTL